MKTSAALWALLAAALGMAAPAPHARRFWIADVVIVSPERPGSAAKGAVLIEDGRIARVERNPTPEQLRGAAVVSGHGQYLIPGLIDAHVHLASIPGMALEPAAGTENVVREYFRQLPRSYLYYGYTTLVDVAAFREDVLRDFRQAPLHPDLYDCGASIVYANGYPMSFAPPEARFRLFPNFLYDPRQAGRIPPEYAPAEHTPEAAVARAAASGAVCVKTYFERGFAADRNLPVMTAEELAALRRAASARGLVLMMHANGYEAQRFAVDGGVDAIVHGMWKWGEWSAEPKLPAAVRTLADRIVERRIAYQPTIQVLYGELAYFYPGYLQTAAIPKVVPKTLLAWFRSPAGQWFGKELNADRQPDAAIREDYERGPLRRVRQVTEYLSARDANFSFGTDTPSGPTYGNLPGLNGYLEMRQLHQAGLSLEQILRAATLHNARLLKLEKDLGSIEPGKTANLVLLGRSPLESVDAYDTITTVWLHGRAIARDGLAADAPQAAASPTAPATPF